MNRLALAIFGAVFLPGLLLAEEATIFYGNGVGNTRRNAEKAKKSLEEAVKGDARFSSYTLSFDLAYNQTDCIPGDAPGPDTGCVGDIFEAFRQLLPSAPPSSFWLLVDGESVPGIDGDEFLRIGGETTNPLPTPPEYVMDLEDHISRYRAGIASGRKVALVAHSQGNLFGNRAYPALSEHEKASFGMVSVATPTDNVLGNFDENTAPYVTLAEDPIRRWYIPFPTLPWNVTNGWPAEDPEWRFHEFSASYLDGPESREKILDTLAKVLESLADPAAGPFTRIADMTTPRAFPCAAKLGNGKVLIVGGACTVQGEVGAPMASLRSASLSPCTVTVSCGSHGSLSCSSNTGSCSGVNRYCPTRGNVTCDGTTTYCPACSLQEYCNQCTRDNDCFGCCRCSGVIASVCYERCGA